MKKFFIINLILQTIMIALSAIYSFYLSTGWDGLVFLILLVFAVPMCVVDIIVLIVCKIRSKRQKNYIYKEKESRKLKKIVQCVCIVLLSLVTLFEMFITIAPYFDDYVLHNKKYDQYEDVYLREEPKVVKYAKRKWKNVEYIRKETSSEIEVSFVFGLTDSQIKSFLNKYEADAIKIDSNFDNETYRLVFHHSLTADEFRKIRQEMESHDDVASIYYETRNENDDVEILKEKNVYYFKDEKYDFDFQIEQYVDDGSGSLFNGGYEEELIDNYDESYEKYVSDSLKRSLENEYKTGNILVDRVLFWANEIRVVVVVDYDADDATVTKTIDTLDDVAQRAEELLKEIDLEKKFQKTSDIYVELDKVVSLEDGFKQYYSVGTYFANENTYKQAKRDSDGIYLPESEW